MAQWKQSARRGPLPLHCLVSQIKAVTSGASTFTECLDEKDAGEGRGYASVRDLDPTTREFGHARSCSGASPVCARRVSAVGRAGFSEPTAVLDA